MDANERQMITGLFDRMRGVGPMEKDRDAEALISQSVRQIPDSAYMLVQSVLVQEHALQQAGARIEELEERVRQLETQATRAPAAAPASGGFLGGLFGGGATARPASSVPATGRQPAFQAANPQPGRSPWGQPAMGQSAMGQPAMGQPPAAGGGFMKTAMATAAGVAGGMLLANSISGMMSGSSGAAASPQSAANEAAPQAEAPAEHASYDDSNNDPGVQDAGYDAGGDWGGGDMDI